MPGYCVTSLPASLLANGVLRRRHLEARGSLPELLGGEGFARARQLVESSQLDGRSPRRCWSEEEIRSLVGRTVGRHELLRVLARGSVGIVFHARHRVLQREEAVKVLPRQDRDDEATAGFLNEARSLAGIEHPNIVPVYDAGVDEELHYVAMALLSGGTLEDELGQWDRLPLDRAYEILDEVLAGLSQAHQAGIVHRDLKPTNLLLDGEGHIRVADFGLALLRDHGGSPAHAAGTPAYVAPEVWLGLPATARSDVYAVGCVLFRALTGRLPYTGADLRMLRRQHIGSPIPRADQIEPTIPPELAEVVQSALEKGPMRRPASADEFRRALRAARRGESYREAVARWG